MVDDMHWGKCESCPPGERYKYIPDNSNLCLSCMEDKFGVEHEPQHTAYTQEELRKLQEQSLKALPPADDNKCSRCGQSTANDDLCEDCIHDTRGDDDE